MFKQLREKVALSGITILFIGVALLIFTFVSAYGFLVQGLSIVGSGDLARTIGESLPSIIATGIRIAYLGVMGWMGSLLTIRGITIIGHLPDASTSVTQKPESKRQPEPQKTETEKQPIEPTKPELKPSEPQLLVIPPEAAQIASPANQSEKEQSQTTS